jgi:hypothetical protein
MDFIEYLPSPIAQPFHKASNPSDPQRKDYQRVTLENMLSYNAIVLLSYYFQEYTSSIDEDGETKNNLPPLNLKFDLSQMSLGKWQGVCRETSSILNKYPGIKKAPLITEIIELYHGKSKKWCSEVDKLIQQRNQDAHGAVGEIDLDKRNGDLAEVLKKLSFYKDYELLVPTNDLVEDGIKKYNTLKFHGVESISTTIDFKDLSVSKFIPMIYGKKTELSLSPLLIFKEIDNGGELFWYTKVKNKKKSIYHYLGLGKALDLKGNESDPSSSYQDGEEISKELIRLRFIVEDESLVDKKEPNLEIFVKKSKKTIPLDKDFEIEIVVENKGELSAENICIECNLSEAFKVQNQEGKKKNSIEYIINELTPNSVSKPKKFKIKTMESGVWEFPELFISSYNYQDDINENEIEVKDQPIFSESFLMTITDPNDPDSLVPVINLYMSSNNSSPKVGEQVDLTVTIDNIGGGVANDVDVLIMPPINEFKMVSGSQKWLGKINPKQKQVLNFSMVPTKPGIFSVGVRDVLYKDNENMVFLTEGIVNHNILVKDFPKTTLKFMMKEFLDELYIDKEEKVEIDKYCRKFSSLKLKDELPRLERDIQIELIEKSIRTVGSELGYKVKDGSYKNQEETKTVFSIGQKTPFILLKDKVDGLKVSLRLELEDSIIGNKNIEETWKKQFRQVSFSEFNLSEFIKKYKENSLLKLIDLITQTLKFVGRSYLQLEKFKERISEELMIDSNEVSLTKQKGNLIEYEYRNPSKGLNLLFSIEFKENKFSLSYRLRSSIRNKNMVLVKEDNNPDKLISGLRKRILTDMNETNSSIFGLDSFKNLTQWKSIFNEIILSVTKVIGEKYYLQVSEKGLISFYFDNGGSLFNNESLFLGLEFNPQKSFIHSRYISNEYSNLIRHEDGLELKFVIPSFQEPFVKTISFNKNISLELIQTILNDSISFVLIEMELMNIPLGTDYIQFLMDSKHLYYKEVVGQINAQGVNEENYDELKQKGIIGGKSILNYYYLNFEKKFIKNNFEAPIKVINGENGKELVIPQKYKLLNTDKV